MIQAEQLWLAVEPVDMRLGIDGLSLKVQQALGRSPCDGSAYAFRNRAGNRIKLLIWDATCVWLCQRRLHQGLFHWPLAGETVCMLSANAWQWLVAGVEWQRLQAAQPAQPAHWRT